MITIIPAIDIIDGKCVRLSRGEYASAKTYNENPLDVALAFADAGCRRLHLVDLDGAKSKHIVNYRVIEAIASRTDLVIDFGGGVKSDEDLHIAFESGAQMVTGGSIALTDPTTFRRWLSRYGGERIILGADSKNGKIAISGWTEQSDADIVPFINGYVNEGVRQVISTDINVDGMLTGPSTALYKRILDEVDGVHIIASGGVGSIEHIVELAQINVPEVIVGKAIYENKISLNDIERINRGELC